MYFIMKKLKKKQKHTLTCVLFKHLQGFTKHNATRKYTLCTSQYKHYRKCTFL